MQIEAQPKPEARVGTFFSTLFAELKKGGLKTYSLTITVRFYRNEQDSQKEFSREQVEGYLERAVEKQLGKVGLAKFALSIGRVLPFDHQAEVSLEDISADDFCLFWSSLAFSSRVRM